jgi:hypothetical protein
MNNVSASQYKFDSNQCNPELKENQEELVNGIGINEISGNISHERVRIQSLRDDFVVVKPIKPVGTIPMSAWQKLNRNVVGNTAYSHANIGFSSLVSKMTNTCEKYTGNIRYLNC